MSDIALGLTPWGFFVLYWQGPKGESMTQDSIVARFQFRPASAPQFLEDGRQEIEMQFDDVREVIEYCSEFEDSIADCIAYVNGRVVSLADQPKK